VSIGMYQSMPDIDELLEEEIDAIPALGTPVRQ
jgi:hypothetical protein